MEFINCLWVKILLYKLSLLSAFLSALKNRKFQKAVIFFSLSVNKKKENSSLADTVTDAKCLCKCNPHLSFVLI